jgi:hypothetical protein
MPPVSEKQARAMFAAASGHSTLGIPESVGKEFVAKDSPEVKTLYVCRHLRNSSDVLAWARSQGLTKTLNADDLHVTIAYSKQPVDWASLKPRDNSVMVAGGPRAIEALGKEGDAVVLRFESDRLDERHQQFKDAGASWDWPEYKPHLTIAYKGEGEDIDLSSIEPFAGDLEFGPEEFAEVDEDWKAKVMAADSVAMDRATVRSKDADGHMKVERTPITRAIVSPYYGREIPQWQTLGLEPERVYQVYRDAEELEKAAKTFEGKPVLSDHIASRADNHPKLATVGAIGAPVEMVGDTLYAPLTIWDQSAIDDIESGEKKNLSCSYRYEYDPTPGTAPNGMPFDGSMKAISANHVALVLEPRVPGSMVADAMPADMATTIPNSAIPAVGIKRAAAQSDEKEPKMAGKSAKDRARDEGGLMERVKEKLSAEDYKALDEFINAKADDEAEEDDKKAKDEEESKAEEKKVADKAKDKAADDEEDEDDKKADDEEETVSKEAMDAAISSSVTAAVKAERKHQADIREAERFVRPWVGDLAVAYDSAADVYKAALEANGRSVKDVHPSAYRTILEMTPKPGQRPAPSTRLAMDGAKSNGFAERFPETARIGVSLR